MYIFIVVVIGTDILILGVGFHGWTFWFGGTMANPVALVSTIPTPDGFIPIYIFTQAPVGLSNFRAFWEWRASAFYITFDCTLFVVNLFICIFISTEVFKTFILLK